MEHPMAEVSDSLHPEVSVIMPCYNASRWMEEAVDSVLAQSFRNFELILVNDGSTDKTWDIIESYCKKDGRVVAISKNNTGLADTLNAGISKARGVWIARLDADDLSEPDRLEKQLIYVHAHPEVVLLGLGFVEIDESGNTIKNHHYPTSHNSLVRHLERLQRFFPHSSAFFRRDIVLKAGGYNPLFRKAQDWDLWLRISKQGEISCLKDCLVRVRKHSSQISNSGQGISQLVYGISAVVCHFLRKQSLDPSAEGQETWLSFIEWVEKQVVENNFLLRRHVWSRARAEYFSPKDRKTGAIRFLTTLLLSGYVWRLIWEKMLGSSLPRNIARRWVACRNLGN
jgi:glycosyltransferase involved in cell wall biosynthesis